MSYSQRLVFLFLLASSAVRSQSVSTGVRLSGQVQHSFEITAAMLSSMPRDSVSWAAHNGSPAMYSGVTLQTLLQAAGAPSGPALRGTQLVKYLLVTCRDGYKVMFSLAELDASFAGRKVLFATQVNGQALPAEDGPFRLVVPDDKAGARSCRQVQSLVVGGL